MSKVRNVSGKYTKLIIDPKYLIELAELCFIPWKREFEAGKREWIKTGLPQLEQSIDKHNKDVEAKKSVYSFNTYLPIGESDKKSIVERERTYFLHTSRKVYQFYSKFTVGYGDRTETETYPDFLDNINWSRVKSLNFSVNVPNNTKKIDIVVKNRGIMDEELSYEIEGSDVNWVNNTREEVERIISKISKPNTLAEKRYFIWILTASMLAYTSLKVINQFQVSTYINKIAPWIPINFITFSIVTIVFIFASIKLARILSNSLPLFDIKEYYDFKNTTTYVTGAFILTAAFSPIIWNILNWIF